jgi:hypothetical protein
MNINIVHETIVAEEKQYYVLVCVCMRMRACVYVGTLARGRVHAHTCI